MVRVSAQRAGRVLRHGPTDAKGRRSGSVLPTSLRIYQPPRQDDRPPVPTGPIMPRRIKPPDIGSWELPQHWVKTLVGRYGLDEIKARVLARLLLLFHWSACKQYG